MRLTVADSISPSYFVAIAAVQLGFFREEGLDMEFVFTPADPSQALRDGVVDFKVTQGPQLREAVLKDRLDDPQPIVAQIGSMSRGHAAKNIQGRCGICPINLRAVSGGERKSLE